MFRSTVCRSIVALALSVGVLSSMSGAAVADPQNRSQVSTLTLSNRTGLTVEVEFYTPAGALYTKSSYSPGRVGSVPFEGAYRVTGYAMANGTRLPVEAKDFTLNKDRAVFYYIDRSGEKLVLNQLVAPR
ncbi:MAG TPA: hypothetical protein VIJ12_11495 [Candidatus Baltobacteraceae bacterium]